MSDYNTMATSDNPAYRDVDGSMDATMDEFISDNYDNPASIPIRSASPEFRAVANKIADVAEFLGKLDALMDEAIQISNTTQEHGCMEEKEMVRFLLDAIIRR